MRTPHRLQVGTSYEDAISLLNDNFEKSVQDISDLGASESTSVTFITGSLASAATFSQIVYILPYGAAPAANSVILAAPALGLRGAVPAVDIYVDNTTSGFLYPTGSSLTPGQLALTANVSVNLTTQGSGLASMVFNIRNCDSISHSYYITCKLIYLPEISNG